MKKNKILLFSFLLIFLLSGCSPSNGNLIGPDTGGIWQALVKCSSYVVIFFSRVFDDNLVFGVIGLAITFNILLLPFTIQQQRFSQKIAKITPKLKKIDQKYAKYARDDEEAQRRKSAEILALYQRNKINPAAGCLPMLVQFPLLIAVYGGVTNLVVFTQEIDGVVTNGLTLFGATDLQSNLFGLDFALKATQNPILLILPILSGLLSYLSIKISNFGVDTSENPSMKMMLVLSPIMSIIIGLSLPAVISVYWIVGTIFRTIITLWYKRHIIKQFFDRKKIEKKTTK